MADRKCTTPGCVNALPETLLSCPTCIKLHLPPCYFCGQDCFKSYWPEHKKVHKAASAAAEPPHKGEHYMPSWAFDYSFTGPLRPWQQSSRRIVPPRIPRPDYASHPSGRSASEESDKSSDTKPVVYKGQALEDLKHTCRMGREVLDLAGRALRVGVTCDEIDRVVHEACVERDCYPSPLNYYAFPKSVCTSVNEVICHGIPDAYEVKDGDIVNIDVTTFTRGYHGDLNETFMVGRTVDDESKNLVETAFLCLQGALAEVKPGTFYRDLGPKINRIAKSRGCSVVRTYSGHGIGSLFHTSPNVPHYDGNKAKGVMQAGHVFTVEPMINAGAYQDVTWGDGWTAVTRDGKRSAQFEHTVLVTEKGCEILTAREGEPVMVWDASKLTR